MAFTKKQPFGIVFLCVVVRTFSVDTNKTVIDNSLWEDLSKVKSEVFVGIVVIILSSTFLWIAEKQTVKHEQLLRGCREAVLEVRNPEVIFRNCQSCPVHVQGNTSTDCRRIKDNDLGYTPDVACVRMRRIVEMYQWQESKKDQGKGRGIVYSYHQVWSEHDINSSAFHDKNYRNPRRQPDSCSTVMNADVVKIGAYILMDRQVAMMEQWEPCSLHTVPPASVVGYYHLHPHIYVTRSTHVESNGSTSLDGGEGRGYQVFNGTLDDPRIGTVRVRYDIIREGGPVTTVAVQDGNTFRAFTEEDAYSLSPFRCLQQTCSILPGHETHRNYETYSNHLCWETVTSCAVAVSGCPVSSDIVLLQEKHLDVPGIFTDEIEYHVLRMIWTRLGCYLLLSLGTYLLLEPIAALFTAFPFLGALDSCTAWGAALLMGCVFGMLVTSVAWILYRPHWLAGRTQRGDSNRYGDMCAFVICYLSLERNALQLCVLIVSCTATCRK